MSKKRKEVVKSIEEAVAQIKDGQTVAIGGFGADNHPMAIVREMIRTGKKNLTIVASATAGLEIDLLIGAGCVKKLIDDRITTLDGRLPVNPSGGLCSRGHPVGATGLLQICELVWQMRGEAGPRQIDPLPKLTMAQNQGGLLLGQDSAVYGCTILKS